jgi:hypothetical protein
VQITISREESAAVVKSSSLDWNSTSHGAIIVYGNKTILGWQLLSSSAEIYADWSIFACKATRGILKYNNCFKFNFKASLLFVK